MDWILLSILITLITILFALGFEAKHLRRDMHSIYIILKDLQNVINLDSSKETAASLVDIGKKLDSENAIDNISRSNNLWEEDGLEGEEIESIYAR